MFSFKGELHIWGRCIFDMYMDKISEWRRAKTRYLSVKSLRYYPDTQKKKKKKKKPMITCRIQGFSCSVSVSFQSSVVSDSCDPMNHSTPGLPVYHQLPEFTQIHVHRVGDAIQPSHPLLSPSPPAPNPSQHQGLFQWISSSHQVAKVLEFQPQHQSFQWTPRTDLL